ncbi:hypothetical protein ACQ4PT_045832 [Festuca glaucescens]
MLAFAGAAPSSRTPLDAFRLHLVDGRSTSSDRWMRRGLKRRPATVDIHCNLGDIRGMVEWPPSHVNLATAACRLTRLTLYGVTLRHGFAEKLGALCPVLQDLRIDNCHHHSSHCTIASPSLKILTVFCRMSYPYSSTITLAIASPRLATLVLFVPFGGTGGHPVITAAPGHDALASLARASICIYDRDRPNKRPNKTKLEFLRSMRVFLARLSNVRILRLSGFTTTALLDHESQEFPTFQNLTTLVLRCCDVGAFNSQVLLRILDTTPNLENIGLYHCKFSGRLKGGRRKTQPSKQRVKTLVQHKNLRSIETKYQPDDQTHRKEVFEKCSGKMQLWRPVKRSYAVVPSLYVNMGRGEVSNAARNAPVPEMTIGLGRLRITMPDPVATTTMEDMAGVSVESKEYFDIVNKTFGSEDDRFQFYNSYTLEKGFSLRRSYVEWDGASKKIIRRKLVCSREGCREEKHLKRKREDRKRKTAQLTI